MSFVEVTFDGYDFTEADVDDLSVEFAVIGPTYSTGGWAPAAIPAATVEVVLTFVGQTIAGLLIEKVLESTWKESAEAWSRYRKRRVQRGGLEPELCRFVMRADDFELIINGVLDPTSVGVLGLLELLATRRASGALRDFPIRRITTPCTNRDGTWDVLDRFEYVSDGDFTVWYVESRVATPDAAFYDAQRDSWLEPG